MPRTSGSFQILRPVPNKRVQGFSLIEILVVCAIIGVIASIAISMMSGGTLAAQRAHAFNTEARLNAAVKLVSQTRHTISTAKNDSATTDEMKVLHTLQWSPRVSEAPAFTPYYQPATSALTTEFRLRWTGTRFEILEPPTVGSGIRLEQNKGDMKTTKVDLTGFTPDPAAS